MRNLNSASARLSQLERGETGDRQNPSDDPETDHDLRLLPALLLEMMVERRHAKDAPPGHLIARDLDDDRYRFEHEETTDDGEDQFVLGDDTDRSERCADRQRSGVAHEHHSWRSVEPQETEARPDHRAAKHRQLACP